jgi:hypothetical protein
LITRDLRTETARALAEYQRADLRLDDPAIAPMTRTQLEAQLALSRTAFNNGDFDLALTELEVFDGLLESTTPLTVPNRYRARRDLNNVRGEIATLSANIAFFLRRLDD